MAKDLRGSSQIILRLAFCGISVAKMIVLNSFTLETENSEFNNIKTSLCSVCVDWYTERYNQSN